MLLAIFFATAAIAPAWALDDDLAPLVPDLHGLYYGNPTGQGDVKVFKDPTYDSNAELKAWTLDSIDHPQHDGSGISAHGATGVITLSYSDGEMPFPVPGYEPGKNGVDFAGHGTVAGLPAYVVTYEYGTISWYFNCKGGKFFATLVTSMKEDPYGNYPGHYDAQVAVFNKWLNGLSNDGSLQQPGGGNPKPNPTPTPDGSGKKGGGGCDAGLGASALVGVLLATQLMKKAKKTK